MIQSSHIVIAGLAILVIGGVYVDYLSGRLDAVTIERDDAIADRMAAEKALIVLADEAASAAERQLVRSTARERISGATGDDDGVVAPVIWWSLSAADEIGGLK